MSDYRMIVRKLWAKRKDAENRYIIRELAHHIKGLYLEVETAALKADRGEILSYFVELCGPHLDPAIFDRTDEELRESFMISKREEFLERAERKAS